jgi:RNA polymerase sigma-70 factor, ECF subfamily
VARDRDDKPPASRLDPEALPELIDRLYRAAWAMCGSPHDAEDLVQETLTRALGRPRHLRGSDPLPYLMRALRNVYLTDLRTASRRPRITELPADESSTMESSRARPDLALERRATFDAITALPDECRAALVAVDLIGLSYGEAARVLQTREATIASRLFRAREQVARAVRDDRPPRAEGSVTHTVP